jgi:hypothetical protein
MSFFFAAPTGVKGGIVYEVGSYQINAFETSGTLQVPSNLDVDILIVAGGGGGGDPAQANYGGGGGAGGLIFKPNYQINQGTYTATVGSGGDGAGATGGFANEGGNSEIFGLTAIGGGRGGDNNRSSSNGGSGGGGGYNNPGGSGLQPASADGGFGNDGGNGTSSENSAAGGGGAGEPGNDGAAIEVPDGGDGLNYTIFGTNYGEIINGEAWFAGGGGGSRRGGNEPYGVGGKGGGGNGGAYALSNGPDLYTPGLPNTGGGGGGGSNLVGGANGGSGIILVRSRKPGTETFGLQYANSYLATTGGTLFTLNGGGNINSIVDSMTDGDALVLGPGSYDVDLPNIDDTYVDDFMRSKDILVAGDVDNAADVDLFADSRSGTQRTYLVGHTDLNNSYAQYAFLTVRPSQSGDTDNYTNTIVGVDIDGTGVETHVNLTNCILDLSNYLVSPSWEYNNNGSFKDVRFTRCTFANYSGWQGSYSTGTGTIFVNDTIYEDERNTESDLSESNIATNVSLDSAFYYNQTNHSTRGHLFVPNTNAIF